MQALEIPGYTVSEFERLAGLPRNSAYKLIRKGELEVVVDITGQYRVPFGEAAVFIRMREKAASYTSQA